ncbi:hypothetical protein Glove_230g16 [Diversispora epigaea]|uniref:RanBD1 domain-containing protein n=1 Tax=Diversispora epigaea TaxID=1348612 RepID=A0A397IFK1_9GLOM|nr:hypothetical protein Glove_230g16 [Diversispora epigaea]
MPVMTRAQLRKQQQQQDQLPYQQPQQQQPQQQQHQQQSPLQQKRGRGRPRKNIPQLPQQPPQQKRGRGRPRKNKLHPQPQLQPQPQPTPQPTQPTTQLQPQPTPHPTPQPTTQPLPTTQPQTQPQPQSQPTPLPQSQGVFGSGTKYSGSSFMGGFASMALSSQKSNMSIFDEQPSQNDDENKNEIGMEKEVPLGTETQTLFHELEVSTGEENESTRHSIRAKLYCLDGQTWKERGVGILKINYPKNNEKSPRLVMRADNVLRVILNVSLFHGMHIERSQEKFVRLFAFEGDILVHLAVKLPNSNAADDLYKAIMDAISPAQNQQHP